MKEVIDKKNILWTWKRQLVGNLAPFCVGLPFEIIGIAIMAIHHQLLGAGLAFFIFGVISSAISLNWLAMIGSRELQREFDVWYQAKVIQLPAERIFVGYSSPKFHSLLDPHEDIGYFYITSEIFGFCGEIYDLQFPVSSLQSVSMVMNPHSILGLGGFISIRGLFEDKRIELLIEPRSKTSLFANKSLAKKLLLTIKSRLPDSK